MISWILIAKSDHLSLCRLFAIFFFLISEQSWSLFHFAISNQTRLQQNKLLILSSYKDTLSSTLQLKNLLSQSWKSKYFILPYIESHSGIKWNRHSIRPQSSSYYALQSTSFSTQNAPNIHSLYSIGAGINYIFNQHLSISIGYHYDWLNDSLYSTKKINNRPQQIYTELMPLNKPDNYTILANIRYKF